MRIKNITVVLTLIVSIAAQRIESGEQNHQVSEKETKIIGYCFINSKDIDAETKKFFTPPFKILSDATQLSPALVQTILYYYYSYRPFLLHKEATIPALAEKAPNIILYTHKQQGDSLSIQLCYDQADINKFTQSNKHEYTYRGELTTTPSGEIQDTTDPDKNNLLHLFESDMLHPPSALALVSMPYMASGYSAALVYRPYKQSRHGARVEKYGRASEEAFEKIINELTTDTLTP